MTVQTPFSLVNSSPVNCLHVIQQNAVSGAFSPISSFLRVRCTHLQIFALFCNIVPHRYFGILKQNKPLFLDVFFFLNCKMLFHFQKENRLFLKKKVLYFVWMSQLEDKMLSALGLKSLYSRTVISNLKQGQLSPGSIQGR